MNRWLISVTAIVILTAAADIIMPSGKTKKLVRSIFSIVCLFVILFPISVINKDYDSVQMFLEGGEGFDLDMNYLQFLSLQRAELLEGQTENYLNDKGFCGVEIKVQMVLTKNEYTVDKAYVNVAKLSIIEKNQHININGEITKLVADFLSLDYQKVIIYER